MASARELCDKGIALYEKKDYEEAFRQFRAAAELGDPEADYRLGLCYTRGRGTDKDGRKARQHFLRAAEQGHPGGQSQTARCCLEEGPEKNGAEAMEWLQKAVAQDPDEPEANYQLGRCHEFAWGTDKDPKKALEHLRRAAERDHVEAQNMLGVLLLVGEGTEADEAAAFRWFQRAAAIDPRHKLTNYHLGYCWQNGYGTAPDLDRAIPFYLAAADQGHPEAQYEAGRYWLDEAHQNLKAAQSLLRRAADQLPEHAGAAYALGRCCECLGNEANEAYLAAEPGSDEEKAAHDRREACYDEAFLRYERAAELGCAEAACQLGRWVTDCLRPGYLEKALEHLRKAVSRTPRHMEANYWLGRLYDLPGKYHSERNSFRHYLIAAEEGNAEALFKAGFSCSLGKGTGKDEKKGWSMIQKAADSGWGDAWLRMGIGYEFGRYGCPEKDRRKALECYQKASELGIPEGLTCRNKLMADLGLAPIGGQPPRKTETPQKTAAPAPPKKPAGDPAQTPSSVREPTALERLKAMTGLKSVKKELDGIIALHKTNLRKRDMGLKTMPISMHMVFTGNPGTGKTTAARLVGEIYRELGLLQGGNFEEVSRPELVAPNIGGTAVMTKNVIQKALDGVLFIDEAYSLTKEDGGRDFGTEAVETLLREMDNHRDRLAVIAAGYDKEMRRFLDSNPGLSSRFETVIHFEDYKPDELLEIFHRMVREGWNQVEESAEPLLADYFDRLYRTRDENFGNARDVRNFYDTVQKQNAARLAGIANPTRDDLLILTRGDVQAAIDQLTGAPNGSEPPALERLRGLIGLDQVKEEVEELRKLAFYQKLCREADVQLGESPAMHMVFTGSPGTGKTTVARLISEIYRDLGVLPKGHLVEVKREHLVGDHLGQTAQKTKAVTRQADGGVLFIDEAYALVQGDQDSFGNEAVAVLLAEMENRRETMAVIVAGYEREMRTFIESNSGLQSRFTRYIRFEDYDGEALAKIFRSMAKQYTFGPGAEAELDRIFREMYDRRDRNFGNARDVRSFFYAVTVSLASRLFEVEVPTREELTRITREDLLEAGEKWNRRREQTRPPEPPKKRSIGFISDDGEDGEDEDGRK